GVGQSLAPHCARKGGMEPVRPRHSKGSPSYDRLTRTILYLTLCPSGNAIVIELSQYWIVVLPPSSTAQVSAPVVATHLQEWLQPEEPKSSGHSPVLSKSAWSEVQ